MTQSILALLIAIGSAQSAETTATPPPPEQNGTGKKIVVTGSYIKRIDEEGPSAVVTLKKEDLQKTGLNSVGDVLRDQAVITAVGREASGSSEAGTSTAQLRAFGSDSILVLLNGLRLPKIGGGNSVDLNLIPISALERVEILKDGASATYGSDAVGGVINFITKKDYNNTDASINYSMPEEKGGSRLDATISSGYSTEKWSVMGVLQARKNDIILDKDRSYSKMENIFTDGSNFGSPGTWYDDNGGPNLADASCTVNDQGHCTFDFTKFSSGVPDLEQYSGLISGRYNFTENLRLTTSHIYNYRDVYWKFAPAPDRITFANDGSIPWLAGLNGGPPVGDVDFWYRPVEELGPRDNENITQSYTGQASLEGKFAPTWDWEFSNMYGISRTEETGVGGYARVDVLQTLAAGGLFDPTKPAGSKDSLAAAHWEPYKEIRNIHYSSRFITSAPLYNGGDNFGPIAFAAGLSADWQSYFENVDAVTAAGNLFGGAGSAGAGRRNFQAAFTEFSLFPIDDVEVQLAARYDSFSDFGNTLNPKLSVSWQATPKVLLRTSLGTGFRAPNLDNLYGGEAFGFPSFIDRKACSNGVAGTCRGRQYELRSRGNPNLDEERSFFYNAGVVMQPKKNWNITIDGWGAIIEDQVALTGILGDATLLERAIDAQGGNGRQYLIDKYGITINRLGTGAIDFVDSSSVNIGKSQLAGVDVGINTQKDIRLFRRGMQLLTGMEHTQFFKRSQTTFEEIGPRKNSDVFWKNTLTVGLRFVNQTVRVAAQSITGGDKAQNSSDQVGQTTGFGSLPVYTQYNLTYTYANLWKGNLTLGVRNIFDSSRPIDDTVAVPTRLDLDLYDPSGRTYQAGYSISF